MKTTHEILCEHILYNYKAYNSEAKKEFKRLGKKYCLEIAKTISAASHYSFNPGGIAVSGDHNLQLMMREPYKMIHLFFNCDFGSSTYVYYRTITDLNDWTGGINNRCPIESADLKTITQRILFVANGGK